MSLAGVRGAITLAGILTLPLALDDGTPFPARDLAIFLAAGVIVVTLLAATFALPPILRGLELPPQMGRLIVLKQNDAPDSPAAKTLAKAVAHHRGEGRRVLFAEPPAGVKDINDLARQRRD